MNQCQFMLILLTLGNMSMSIFSWLFPWCYCQTVKNVDTVMFVGFNDLIHCLCIGINPPNVKFIFYNLYIHLFSIILFRMICFFHFMKYICYIFVFILIKISIIIPSISMALAQGYFYKYHLNGCFVEKYEDHFFLHIAHIFRKHWLKLFYAMCSKELIPNHMVSFVMFEYCFVK